MKTNLLYLFVFMLLALAGLGFVLQKIHNLETSAIQFSISLSGANKDILVLYHRSKNQHFSAERRIKRKIVGDGTIRTFNYELPKGTSNVRIDLGQNKNQEKIDIENIIIKDSKDHFKIIKNKQLRQLRFNRYCSNFKTTESGLSFTTHTVGRRYAPQIEDLNIPYLLYFTR